MPPSTRSKPKSTRSRNPRFYALVVVALIGGPALALGVPDKVRIKIAKEHGAGDPTDAALFSHWEHDAYTCASCHPSTFPQRRMGFTHDDMNQGKFCGSCHDGRIAFSPKDKGVDCETCHVPTAPKRDINEDDLWK